MTGRAVFVVVFIALLVFGAILYFSEFAPSSGTTTQKNTNTAPAQHENCNQRCINRGFAKGLCLRGTAAESASVCVNQQGTAITNTNIPIPDCNYQTDAQIGVCCCL